mmetsp:Transcript_108732/g.347016  ORF Transcript_108732/g.347016 Transcript_108732/m.347016 type:complete len:320 (+) Transcript_108732:1196-2155(+)
MWNSRCHCSRWQVASTSSCCSLRPRLPKRHPPRQPPPAPGRPGANSARTTSAFAPTSQAWLCPQVPEGQNAPEAARRRCAWPRRQLQAPARRTPGSAPRSARTEGEPQAPARPAIARSAWPTPSPAPAPALWTSPLRRRRCCCRRLDSQAARVARPRVGRSEAPQRVHPAGAPPRRGPPPRTSSAGPSTPRLEAALAHPAVGTPRKSPGGSRAKPTLRRTNVGKPGRRVATAGTTSCTTPAGPVAPGSSPAWCRRRPWRSGRPAGAASNSPVAPACRVWASRAVGGRLATPSSGQQFPATASGSPPAAPRAGARQRSWR